MTQLRSRQIAEEQVETYTRLRALADAEAEKVARIGVAQAIEEQVRAYGGPRYQVTQDVMNRFAEAVERSKVEIVPRIMISGDNDGAGSGGTTGSVFEALLTLLLSERMGDPVGCRSGARSIAANGNYTVDDERG